MRLREDREGLRLTLKRHPSWPAVALITLLWNGVFLLRALFSSPYDPVFVAVASVIEPAAAFWLARELVTKTTVSFDARHFVVKKMLGGKGLKLDLSAIKRFEARHLQDENRHEVAAVLESGHAVSTNIDFEPPGLKWNYSKRRLWSAPPEAARFLATRLDEMLHEARLRGHDTYRT